MTKQDECVVREIVNLVIESMEVVGVKLARNGPNLEQMKHIFWRAFQIVHRFHLEDTVKPDVYR